MDLDVYYAQAPSASERGASGFEEAFDWDVDLLSGYDSTVLENRAERPRVDDQSFFGCDTPGIYDRVRTGGFDAFVVMGWYAKTFWQAVHACRQSGVPVCARGDSQLDPTAPLWKQAAKQVTHRLMLRAFDGFLAVGTQFASYLRHYGVESTRIFHVPHCIDTDRFARQTEEARQDGTPQRIGDRLGLGDAVTYLFVGKFIPVKRPKDFVDAVARRARSGASVSGVMVGTGPLEDELRRAAESAEAPVHFEGFQNQSRLPAYYALADALVLPSASETWGLVVNEAMACGTPAITSDAVGCSPNMIDDGKTGYTFPVGNVDALADRMRTIEKRVRDGNDFQAAVARKTRLHSPEVAAGRTVAAVRSLRSKSPATPA